MIQLEMLYLETLKRLRNRGVDKLSLVIKKDMDPNKQTNQTINKQNNKHKQTLKEIINTTHTHTPRLQTLMNGTLGIVVN